MKILIGSSNHNDNNVMCNNRNGYTPPCSIVYETCPYFCISQCSQKEVRCHKPSVAGLSPTGDAAEN